MYCSCIYYVLTTYLYVRKCTVYVFTMYIQSMYMYVNVLFMYYVFINYVCLYNVCIMYALQCTVYVLCIYFQGWSLTTNLLNPFLSEMGLFTLHNCCFSCWLDYWKLHFKPKILFQSFLVFLVRKCTANVYIWKYLISSTFCLDMRIPATSAPSSSLDEKGGK